MTTTGYEAYLKTPDQEDVLGRMAVLAERAAELDAEIERTEKILKRLCGQKEDIIEHLLPELFEQVGMTEVKTKAGTKLKSEEKIFHNVSKARKAAAMKWLEDHGHGGLIKNTVVVAFNRGQETEVQELLTTLAQQFENVRTDKEVAPATLGALLRNLLKEGKDVNQELFGIVRRTVVTIS